MEEPVTSRRATTHIRTAEAADAKDCGRICYEAFATIADRHGFPHDFPSAKASTMLCALMIDHPRFFGVVAERDGRVVGSNFLDERSTIFSIGPVTVEPGHQNRSVGRALMRAMLERVEQRQAPGVRLVQAAYHNRSLSLYAKLGFGVREPLATLAGESLDLEIAGCAVRTATYADVDACNALCLRVHGHDRSGELRDAIAQQAASVVEQRGSITGYTTGIGFFSHLVAETNDDLKALIGAARHIEGPGLIVPTRNAALLRWCLEQGLSVVHMLNLMTIGFYREPQGAYLTSIGY
jgi:predicted N-acetyltransferase YhbS